MAAYADQLLITDLQERIDRGQVVAVVGAGISIGATDGDPLASWKGLLENGVNRCHEVVRPRLSDEWRDRVLAEIHSSDMHDLLSAAEKVSSKLGAPSGGEYSRWLVETVGLLRPRRSDAIEALHCLGVKLATTNYDGLIETVTGLPPVTWRDGAKVERVIRDDDDGVLHLHGYWEQPESVVLGIRSYEQVLGNAHAQNVLHALQTTKTLLFVGYGAGLKDPNFGELLRWTRTVFSESKYRRFRLAPAREVDALQQDHPPEERLFVLSFGNDHSDLVPFLRQFRPHSKRSAPPIFPECKSTMLPPSPRCFGRENEVEELVAILLAENPQPVSILGPPGIGKTTISLAALHDSRVVRRYGSRRYFVRCDAIKTRQALAAQIGLVVGLQPGPDVEQSMLAALSVGPTALVIDNAETAWEADPLTFEEFLGQIASIPTLALVASVRGTQRPFGVGWRESIQPPPLSRLAARDAFLAIAGQKFKDDIHLDSLLLALDSVPLAVTLMAYAAEGEPNLDGSWTRWQQERTEMLRRADANERLTNIELSYEISIKGPRMTEEGRQLLSLIAYLPNGVSPEELERIYPTHCRRAVSVLRKAGLAFDESGRLRLLAPLREYVRRQHLPKVDDLAALVDFYVEFAVAEGYKVGAEGGSEAIRRIAPRVANIETAIIIGLESSNPEAEIAAALAMGEFTRFTGLGSFQPLENAAFIAQKSGKIANAANCAKKLGDIALARSDHAAARARFEQALPLYRQVSDVLGEANCIQSLGDIALERSDRDAARVCYEQALPLYRQVNDVLGEANCIQSLGDIALACSLDDAARESYEQAVPLYRRVDSVLGEANCIQRLGDIALRRQDYNGARDSYEQALPLYRQVGSVLGEANCIQRLGDIALRRSDNGAAQANYQKALELYEGIPEPYSIGFTHRQLAHLASNNDEKTFHVLAAGAAWERIKRDDLVAKLRAEFG
jgi:tetratricopeptide (TPR) repeat protein